MRFVIIFLMVGCAGSNVQLEKDIVALENINRAQKKQLDDMQERANVLRQDIR